MEVFSKTFHVGYQLIRVSPTGPPGDISTQKAAYYIAAKLAVDNRQVVVSYAHVKLKPLFPLVHHRFFIGHLFHCFHHCRIFRVLDIYLYKDPVGCIPRPQLFEPFNRSVYFRLVIHRCVSG